MSRGVCECVGTCVEDGRKRYDVLQQMQAHIQKLALHDSAHRCTCTYCIILTERYLTNGAHTPQAELGKSSNFNALSSPNVLL